MRTDTARFHAANTQLAKEPRHVVNIEFDTGSIYCTSHGDISGVPGVVMNNVLQKPVVVSQRIVPDEGRSEIGSASFRLVDLASVFTNEIRTKLAAGHGLRRRRVRFYRGFAGFAWADMQLIQTQIVRDASYEGGAYSVQCNDVTREQRKDVFALAETTLTANVSATDTTIPVNNATAFTGIVHDASYSDAPSATVGYIKIKDEIIRYPVASKTSVSFVGCTRGVFGSRPAAYTVDAAVAQDRREKVSEYVYLEGPVPKILYAIQTGILHGDSANLPATWHCGIDSTLIRLADYTGIGPDLWVPGTPTAGLRCRFEGLGKTDGKGFIEREILTLIGCFQPVYADGSLGLKRATRIFRDAAPIFELNESNSVQVGALQHDMTALHNDFRIHWNYNGERFTRTNVLVDVASITAHGRAPLRELSFKGLHGSIHTDGFILKLVDSQRDRYAGPPERLRVAVLHALNRAEVGDVVRARYTTAVRDYAGPAGSMDRAFEIQQFVDDGERIEFELFGSTAAPSVQSPTTPASALPDAWYTSQGTNLSTVLTIVGDVVQAGTYTLNGHADLNNAAAIYYYAGNLTIGSGVTINITGNVQLRIRGFLQINGTINGQGGGLAGVSDSGASLVAVLPAENTVDPVVFNTIAGNPGYVGGSRGMDGFQMKFGTLNRNNRQHTVPAGAVFGKHPTAPPLILAVVAGVLTGLQTDLRGSGGAPGGRAVAISSFNAITNSGLGGAGAAGGAGVCLVTRGGAFGASGSIDLDGNNSAATSLASPNGVDGYPGAGGAGGPGTLYWLLDGSGISMPSIGTNNFFARTGTVPVNGTPLPKRTYNDAVPPIADAVQPVAGYMDEGFISDLNLFNACQRVQYVPAPETPAPDVAGPPPTPTNLAATGSVDRNRITFTPPVTSDPWQVEVYASIDNQLINAVLAGYATSTVFFHDLPDGGNRFYFARTRVETPTGVRFSAFTPTGPTSTIEATAIVSELKIVGDPEFNRATDESYWNFEIQGAGASTIQILPSGGIDGGLCRFTLNGVNNLIIRPFRVKGFPVTTGQVVQVTVRWRRTNTLTGGIAAASAGIVVSADTGDQAWLDSEGAAGNSAASTAIGSDRQVNLNPFTVNEWFSFTTHFRMQKSGGGVAYPFVGVLVQTLQAGGPPSSTGVIEFDRIDAIIVPDTFTAANAGMVPAAGAAAATTVLKANQTFAAVGYSELSGVPGTFPPQAHTHGNGDLTGYTASDVLAKLLTVDGAGSNLDADLLDGQQGSFYQNAGNLNAGSLPAARIDSATDYAVGGGSTVGGVTIGYRDIPRRTSGLARAECLAISAGVTINTSDMAAGRAFSIYNDSGSAITITQGSGVTLRLAGTATTGNRTLAQRGFATIWCNSASEAVIGGPGVS